MYVCVEKLSDALIFFYSLITFEVLKKPNIKKNELFVATFSSSFFVVTTFAFTIASNKKSYHPVCICHGLGTGISKSLPLHSA